MPDSTPAIVHGLPADPGPVIEMLAQGCPELERVLQRQSLESALAGDARDDFFCVRAMVGDKTVGVVLAQKLPGRTAAVYPPQLVESFPAELATTLLTAVAEPLQTAGVRLAQALLALDQFREEQYLLDAGFTRAATLLYMVGDAAASIAEPADIGLSLEPVTPKLEPRLARVIEASYQGTLDCPLLNGLRTTVDVLAGYRAVGTYRPELWLLARDRDRDVGCLILADHPEAENLELVYLGIVPAARGAGYGLALTKHALWLARQLPRQRVVLAVDAANVPAIRLYEAAGFFGFDQRLVMIKNI